jgi:hypothetical protein
VQNLLVEVHISCVASHAGGAVIDHLTVDSCPPIIAISCFASASNCSKQSTEHSSVINDIKHSSVPGAHDVLILALGRISTFKAEHSTVVPGG